MFYCAEYFECNLQIFFISFNVYKNCLLLRGVDLETELGEFETTIKIYSHS